MNNEITFFSEMERREPGGVIVVPVVEMACF